MRLTHLRISNLRNIVQLDLSLADGFEPGAATRESVLGDLPVRSRASVGEAPAVGPMLIDEYDTTVVVRPGWTARRDPVTDTLVLKALE